MRVKNMLAMVALAGSLALTGCSSDTAPDKSATKGPDKGVASQPATPNGGSPDGDPDSIEDLGAPTPESQVDPTDKAAVEKAIKAEEKAKAKANRDAARNRPHNDVPRSMDELGADDELTKAERKQLEKDADGSGASVIRMKPYKKPKSGPDKAAIAYMKAVMDGDTKKVCASLTKRAQDYAIKMQQNAKNLKKDADCADWAKHTHKTEKGGYSGDVTHKVKVTRKDKASATLTVTTTDALAKHKQELFLIADGGTWMINAWGNTEYKMKSLKELGIEPKKPSKKSSKGN